MLLRKRWHTAHVTDHSELRDLRSEGIHIKNKYKFMVLKITLMPQIREASVWSNVNTKSTLQYPFQFRSDVSLIRTIFSRNWHLLFVLTLLISNLMVVFCWSRYWYLFNLICPRSFSHHEWKQLYTQNVLLIIKHICRNNWITSGHGATAC